MMVPASLFVSANESGDAAVLALERAPWSWTTRITELRAGVVNTGLLF